MELTRIRIHEAEKKAFENPPEPSDIRFHQFEYQYI